MAQIPHLMRPVQTSELHIQQVENGSAERRADSQNPISIPKQLRSLLLLGGGALESTGPGRSSHPTGGRDTSAHRGCQAQPCAITSTRISSGKCSQILSRMDLRKGCGVIRTHCADFLVTAKGRKVKIISESRTLGHLHQKRRLLPA